MSLSGDPADVPLSAKTTGPSGTSLTSYDIKEMPFMVITTSKESGDTTLEIKNVGSRAVVISGGLISTPVGPKTGGVSIKDNSTIQSLVAYGIGILVGIVAIVAGIVLLAIIGAVKYLKGRKAQQLPTPASQEPIKV